ncbi:MAG: hypothetical protein V1804_04685 [Patescibacteria group bacterium]
MKKIIFLFLVSSFFFLLFSSSAKAICPICTITVGAGVGLSRWLGIDDTITGIWIGALIVSSIMWTINWMNSKNIRFKGRKIIITAGYCLIILVPLYWKGIIGHYFNKIWGIDKLLLGIIIGSIVFLASALWYQNLKKKNNDKAYFPFQKVVMPVGFLAIFSAIFYFITKN